MTAKIEARRPKVKANGAAIIIAWVFNSGSYNIQKEKVNQLFLNTEMSEKERKIRNTSKL